MAEREQLQARLDAAAQDAGDAIAEALRELGKRGVLRALQRASADTQLAALTAVFARVEVHPGGVLRVVHSGGVLPDVELELGARKCNSEELRSRAP